MSVEYLVLQAVAEEGPFARVTARKLNRSCVPQHTIVTF
jgi:hypothetical protein